MRPAIQEAYSDAVHNIMFHKRQQWRVTHYAVLAYAVVVALSEILEKISKVEKLLLLLVTLVVLGGSIAVLSNLQCTQTKFRGRLRYIYMTFFTVDERNSLHLSVERRGFLYDIAVLICLYAASLLGAAVTIYLIYR